MQPVAGFKFSLNINDIKYKSLQFYVGWTNPKLYKLVESNRRKKIQKTVAITSLMKCDSYNVDDMRARQIINRLIDKGMKPKL